MNKRSINLLHVLLMVVGVFGHAHVIQAGSEISGPVSVDERVMHIDIGYDVEQVLAGATLAALFQRMAPEDRAIMLNMLMKYGQKSPRQQLINIVSCCPATDDADLCVLENTLDECCTTINAQLSIMDDKLDQILAIIS